MGSYRRVSVALFLKRFIFLKGMFVEAFSPMIMKKKSVNFLMKSVETPQHFSLLSSFIFNALTRLYNFSRELIFFLISKHNDLVQSEQQNWSYPISQLVHFWFGKLSPPYELMYLFERCWIIFPVSSYIVSDIHFLLLAVNGCNFLCWHIIFLSTRYVIFSDVVFIFYMLLHRIHSEWFFIPSPCNQNDFSFLFLPILLFMEEIWSLSLM